MLYLIGRQSKTNSNVLRFLKDNSSCGGRAFTPLHFTSQTDAEAEISKHTANKYFVVPVPTLAVVDGKMVSVANVVRAPRPKAKVAKKVVRKGAKKAPAKKSKAKAKSR